ncbi:conserved phage mega protein [Devosia sp. H5989]|nr:conserved phage mega protein [Devosia sp. H5989]
MADFEDIINTLIAEANAEGPEGMRRVGETILNRAAQSGLTPGQVVRQPHQYTGYWSPGPAARRAQQSDQVRTAAEAAWALAQQPGDPTNGADHYFNPAVVTPSWASAMRPTGTFGGHAFYADRAVPAEALAALLTPAVAPSPAGGLQRQIAYENAGRPQPQVPTPAGSLQRQFAYENAGTPDALASFGIRPTAQTVSSIADLFAKPSNATPILQSNGRLVDPAAAALWQDTPKIFAGGFGSLTPDVVTPTKRSVQSVAMSAAPRIDGVGRTPSFNELTDVFGAQPKTASEQLAKTGVIRTTNRIAGTAALPPGVRPNVTVPGGVNMNDTGKMPSFSSLADMFGTPDRLMPSERDVDVVSLDVANPYGIDVMPYEDFAPQARVADVPLPRKVPQRPMATPVKKTVAVTRPAPVPASPALGYAPSSGGKQSSAATAIAKMFEPAGTLRAGRNGYAYAADGNGGYKQVGTFRPAGMSAQQQASALAAAAYRPTNAWERMVARESSGDGGARSLTS